MKTFVAFILMLFSVSVFAQQQIVSTEGLTPEQQAAVVAQIQEMKRQQGVSLSENVRKEAEAWGELGANMGRAIVGAASEVGVAANEFATTPLGKVTVALVVYKFIGQELLGIIVGIGVLLFGYSLAFYSLKFLRFPYDITYDHKPFLFGAWQRKVVVSYRENDEWKVARFIFGIGLIILSSVVGLNCIF